VAFTLWATVFCVMIYKVDFLRFGLQSECLLGVMGYTVSYVHIFKETV